MEFMAFKLSIEYLLEHDVNISTFVSDRHISIASYIKSNLQAITHYYDLWHLKKSMYYIVG